MHLLEALPDGLRGRCLRALARTAGVRLVAEVFFAGHLRANGLEVANLVAFRRAGPLAMDAARKVAQSLRLLRDAGTTWCPQSVRLRIARAMWLPIFDALLRIEVAGALVAREGGEAILVAYRRAGIAEAIGKEHPVEIRWYGGDRLVQTLKLRLTFAWCIRQRLLGLTFRWQVATGQAERRLSAVEGSADPVVLLPQEEETSSDRSYRTQPHWLQHGSCGVQAVILGNKVFPGRPADSVYAPVSPNEVHALPAALGVGGRLCRMLASITLRLLWCPIDEAPALAATARLLYYADRMAAVVARTGARAFLCCENVVIHADAMQMVAGTMGVRTAAFQYSNMGIVTPAMLTGLDTMLTFGPDLSRAMDLGWVGRTLHSDWVSV